MPPVPSYSMETDLSHGEMRARRRAVEQRLCPLVGTRQGDHQLNRFSASYLILSRTRPTLVAPCPPPRLGRKTQGARVHPPIPLDRPSGTPSVHSDRFSPLTGGCFLPTACAATSSAVCGPFLLVPWLAGGR